MHDPIQTDTASEAAWLLNDALQALIKYQIHCDSHGVRPSGTNSIDDLHTLALIHNQRMSVGDGLESVPEIMSRLIQAHASTTPPNEANRGYMVESLLQHHGYARAPHGNGDRAVHLAVPVEQVDDWVAAIQAEFDLDLLQWYCNGGVIEWGESALNETNPPEARSLVFEFATNDLADRVAEFAWKQDAEPNALSLYIIDPTMPGAEMAHPVVIDSANGPGRGSRRIPQPR